MKKIFSFIMTLCVMLSMALPASAAGISESTMTVHGGISVQEKSATVSPRAIVYRGSYAVPIRTTLFPGYLNPETGEVTINQYVYRTVYTPDTSTSATINSSLYLSSAETAKLVSEFKQKNGAHKEPDVWMIESSVEITNDQKGSYGEYFKFNPVGNFAEPVAADGTVTYSIPRDTSKTYIVTIRTFYFAKEDLTQPDRIGLPNGGYYYYNAVDRVHLSKMIGSVVWLNED